MNNEKPGIETSSIGLPAAPVQVVKTDGCGCGCNHEAAKAGETGHEHCGCGGDHEAGADCGCGEDCNCRH
ncbi:MAG: hypothetical protein ACWA6X_11340 [Bauldia sp.]|jgi:hypothetical protein